MRIIMHTHLSIARALRKRATNNIDMAVEPEKEEKLAHGGIQPAFLSNSKSN
jgi:hypothetical protein